MARGAWDATANTMALAAEQGRNVEERPKPFTPGDFHPFRVKIATPKDESDTIPYNPEILKRIAEGKF